MFVDKPCQVLSDVDPEVLEVVHPFHCGPVDLVGGVVPLLLLSKIHN